MERCKDKGIKKEGIREQERERKREESHKRGEETKTHCKEKKRNISKHPYSRE